MVRPLRISGKCTTYGRVNVLEEALYGFLHQDYEGWNELVIVNDYPLQTLHFEHPKVRIYNLNETFDIIGNKENFTIDKCEGDIIAVMDDDDVALSNHLSNINKYWKDDTNLMHWNQALFYNGPNATKIAPVGNSGIVFSKRVWEEIGRSPIENAGGDMTFVVTIHNLGRSKVALAAPPDEEVGWMYRWGGIQNVYHQSGKGTDTPDRMNIVERNKMHVERLRKQGQIPIGDIQLNPHWDHDYVDIRRRAAIENKKK